MIEELKKLIPLSNQMVSVYLSQQDYDIVQAIQPKLEIKLECDPSLSRGDVIIKSNFTELHSIIDERVDQLLKDNYA